MASRAGPPAIAVVGAGLIGRTHARLVARHARLDAVIDPSPGARAVAAEFGARHETSLEDYLAANRPDGVILATPNALHAPQALAVIAAGIPLLVEKPLADTAAAANHVVAAAASAGVPILTGHHRRHNPLIAAAKAAIGAGRLGPVRAVDAQFWVCKPDAYYDTDWRRRAGAGPLLINLIHDIDLMRHLVGEIAVVEARRSSAARGFEVEDTAAVLVEFETGALGTLSVSDCVVAPWSWELTSGENPAYPRATGACYRIGGALGSLSLPDMRLVTQTPGDWQKPLTEERLPVAPADPADPLERQLLNFLGVIAGTEVPLVSGAEGARTLAVLEAIGRAAATGTPQRP